LYQFNVVVPQLANGDHALVANVGGIASPTGVFLNVRTPVARPDLVVRAVSSAARGSIGRTLPTASATVANNGPGVAGAFRVSWYYSRDAAIDFTDTFSGWSCTVTNGLAVGGTFVCAGDIGVPAGLTPGTWRLGAIVDDLQQLTEESETNNSLVAPTAITLELPVANGLIAAPGGLGFVGSAATNPLPQELRITSPTPGRVFRISSNQTFVTLSASQATTPTTIQVRVNTVGLAPGYYGAEIFISPVEDASNALNVKVGIVVPTPNVTNQLLVNPVAVDFTARAGGPDPAPQVVRFTATGAGDLYWWVLGTADGGSWVTGLDTGGGTVRLVASPQGLAPGTYRATLHVFGPRYVNSYFSVPISFTVSP
jgi:hypothetical protein